MPGVKNDSNKRNNSLTDIVQNTPEIVPISRGI